jgi:hypothetical protein
MVILPAIMSGLFNFLIFLKATSYTQHMNKLSVLSSNSNYLNTRDARLLKHMLFIHVVFVIGWGPICLLSIVDLYIDVSFFAYLFLQLLPALSLLINMLDLFLYNHELTQYLKEQILKYFNTISNINNK